MQRSMIRTWWMQYLVPTVLLLASLFALFPFIDDPDMIWIPIATPLTILIGFVVRPEKVWITPLAMALIIATVIVVGALMGDLEPRGPLPMMYVFTLAFVGAPLLAWIAIGKAIRFVWDDR